MLQKSSEEVSHSGGSGVIGDQCRVTTIFYQTQSQSPISGWCSNSPLHNKHHQQQHHPPHQRLPPLAPRPLERSLGRFLHHRVGLNPSAMEVSSSRSACTMGCCGSQWTVVDSSGPPWQQRTASDSSGPRSLAIPDDSSIHWLAFPSGLVIKFDIASIYIHEHLRFEMSFKPSISSSSFQIRTINYDYILLRVGWGGYMRSRHRAS